jgi:hypothetical protein
MRRPAAVSALRDHNPRQATRRAAYYLRVSRPSGRDGHFTGKSGSSFLRIADDWPGPGRHFLERRNHQLHEAVFGLGEPSGSG